MEHLALEILSREKNGASQYAWLPENASISITDTSEIFDKGNVWSHDFQLNIPANAHIFGTAGEMHGSRLHEQIDKRKARLWVEGLPLFLGYLRLADEVEVDGDGNVDVSFEAGQKTFDEMIEGGKANQVPMTEDVQIGLALWRKRWIKFDIMIAAAAKASDGLQNYPAEGYVPILCNGDNDSAQAYPRMVFPTGTFIRKINQTETEESINFLNTDTPYDEGHPYCNVALCYQKRGYPEDNRGNVDYSGSVEAKREYEFMPANRVNSAPNFFVIYWIRALMKYLGIHIEENQMMDVEDLRRLFFVNTNCSYEVPSSMRGSDGSGRFGYYRFTKSNSDTLRYIAEQMPPIDCYDPKESGITDYEYHINGVEYKDSIRPSLLDLQVGIVRVASRWTDEEVQEYKKNNNILHKAFANSDCFPDQDIKKVIEAIESGFGIRLLFSNDYRRVRIVLIRNLFRSDDVQHVECDITEQVKMENNIRGFRMTYDAGTEDTAFYYKGFADKLPSQKEIWPEQTDSHDYSRWKLDAQYQNIIKQISGFDKTCYVTPNSGNAYGIKIDKDAKRYEDLHPALFGFADFMDAEDGDCTGDEDTIKAINVGFSPAIMNDLNMEEERNGTAKQRFALFVDEEMRPRRMDYKQDINTDFNNPGTAYDVAALYALGKGKSDGVVKPGEFSITSDMTAVSSPANVKLESGLNGKTKVIWDVTFYVKCHVQEGYRLYLQDNYEPNDDGVSPIETHDWGLTLGIMRGSGSDAYVDYSPDDDDREGNDTWDIVPGSNATAHSDTCDDYGNLWDYNGSTRPTIHVTTPSQAVDALRMAWPKSNFDLTGRTSENYLISTLIRSGVVDDKGDRHTLILAMRTIEKSLHGSSQIRSYVAQHLAGRSVADMYAEDKARWNILIEANGSNEQSATILRLQKMAFGGATGELIIDGEENGVGVTDGRFSLKLRAEKPNPYFDPNHPESEANRRYLQIENENLRGRGLMDQFYKEYSYWVRNARIAKMTVRMELAQLLSIDKTKRVRVGDITGFIRKMEYQVSNQSGLGLVSMEIMYI